MFPFAILLRFPVCSDMWQPYLKVIRERAGEAIHVLDQYHIMSNMNKAINEIRAGEARQMKADGYEQILKHSPRQQNSWVNRRRFEWLPCVFLGMTGQKNANGMTAFLPPTFSCPAMPPKTHRGSGNQPSTGFLTHEFCGRPKTMECVRLVAALPF